MPELPEVETVVRGLRPLIVGKTIRRVVMRAPKASLIVSPSFDSRSFSQNLVGQEIVSVERRGKNILVALHDEITLWVHLKMTGHFFWLPKSEPLAKHDLVVFEFDDTEAEPSHTRWHLRFNDYRRFGRLRLFRNDELWEQDGLRDLGQEPLTLSGYDFVALFRRPRMVKQALLDQSFIAGIGNIYADESLYCSRIHPKRLTTSLSRKKLLELHGHIQRILKRAIKLHGTSVDTYSGVNGKTGGFQKYLLAYGREGEPCSRCGAKIVRMKIGARSAHFCPRCQRLK
jgi:formamidopyrimidine-DNA glycosylase